MKHLLALAFLLMAVSGCGIDPRVTPGPDGILAYAPIKNRRDDQLSPATPPPPIRNFSMHDGRELPSPERGFVISGGGSFSRSESFLSFDVDTSIFTFVAMNWSSPSGIQVTHDHRFKVTPRDRDELVRLANLTWAPNSSTQPPMVMDAASLVFLFDKGERKVVDGFGAGEALGKAVDRIITVRQTSGDWSDTR